MVAATLFGIFFIPLFYLAVRRWITRKRPLLPTEIALHQTTSTDRCRMHKRRSPAPAASRCSPACSTRRRMCAPSCRRPGRRSVARRSAVAAGVRAIEHRVARFLPRPAARRADRHGAGAQPRPAGRGSADRGRARAAIASRAPIGCRRWTRRRRDAHTLEAARAYRGRTTNNRFASASA